MLKTNLKSLHTKPYRNPAHAQHMSLSPWLLAVQAAAGAFLKKKGKGAKKKVKEEKAK